MYASWSIAMLAGWRVSVLPSALAIDPFGFDVVMNMGHALHVYIM